MSEISLLPTLESIAERWQVLAGEHPRVPTSQLLTQACAAAGVPLNGREVEAVCVAYRIPPDANRDRRLLLLTVLLGDQRLRLEAAFRLLDPDQRGTVDPAQVQRLVQLFELPEAEAKELVVELNRDGSGEITLADILAFLPQDFSAHPKAYHAAHLGGRPGAHGAGTAAQGAPAAPSAPAQVPASGQPTASPAPASPKGASKGGTSPLQMRIGLFRLLQGAAYRSFRENYSANSETHLRAYDLPYTIPNFAGFVNAALDLYQSLGIVEVGAQQPLEDLRSSVNAMLAQLESRMANWATIEPTAEMAAAEQVIEAELDGLEHHHQVFAAAMELVLSGGLQGHHLAEIGLEDLQLHELNRLRHQEDFRELSLHRHTVSPGDQGEGSSVTPFLERWHRVIVDDSDTRYAGAILPTRYWYEDFMPKLLKAASVMSRSDLAAVEAETEADLDAWFERRHQAGDFDSYATALKAHFLGCSLPVKQELKQAWELSYHYINGVQKRREREEFGRESGYLSEYVAFIDVFLGRDDIERSEMRLSFPYYLGPATWRFMHTSAELIQAMPPGERQNEALACFKRFFPALATMYPCPYCRFHLNRYVVKNREVTMYPIEYLLLGPQTPTEHIEVTIDSKLASITDSTGLRLFLWKLHNTVSSSIARSEPWFHQESDAHYTTRYWPSLDSELARARALAEPSLPLERIERIYSVIKKASHLSILRDELQQALRRGDKEELQRVWERAEASVDSVEQALLASQFLSATYHYDPSLVLEPPHFSAEEEALARSGYYVEA
ncbi:MAG: ERV1/ALR-related protein [Synechococcales cyanobacterium SupBloom_Metag_052]|nr:ERV1/ALR-related protein [Synechococcales cyanobacterium SupBloom_Metag_052]